MCNTPDCKIEPRYEITAKSFKKCEFGDRHETDSILKQLHDPHALYRAAHDFYKRHAGEEIHMTIMICAS